MKVLIVDDEPLALDCVLSMIDWQSMGVAQVRTASNVRQAKELFLQDRADILLCDIEMPGDNGLELVEWIRRQNISAEVILLTAHVNFSYAKQAVDLGCLGYLLKPIDPAELKKGLKSAIQIVHQKQSYAHYRENSDRWMRNKPVMAELFWQKIADFTPPLLPEDIAALQEKYSTDYPQNTTVFPLLCRILVKDLPGVEEQIKNEISAALFPFCDEIIFLPSAGGALLALCIGRGRALTPQRFQQRAEEILGLCETMHGVKLSIYLDCICDLSSVPQAVIRLQEVSRNNIWGTRGVFTTETGVESSLNPPLPNLQLWSKLMLENDYQAFRIELERYREKLLYASKLGAAFLFQLHHDFLQTVYFVLYTKGIQMVNNNLYTNLIAKYNFLNFLKWLKYLEETDFAEYSAFLCKHHVEADELNSFRRAASCMKLCKKGDLLLQDEDILNREALDLSSIPAENFPLLLHYHPLYIYQKRVCKQADAVLAMMLFPDEFTEKEKAVSYAFYQGITTHDSSLSEGVFSVVGIDLNRPESAQAFLEQSLRLDIDDLHHNTEDGLHFANIGLAWLTVVRGFFGFQFRNGAAHFSPKITEFLGDCSFNLQLGQSRINVRYSRDVLHICLLEGAPLTLWVYGKKYRLDSHPVNVQL